jgi:hypothetical protein
MWVPRQPIADMTNEPRTYMALLREATGHERAISFESVKREESAVGDEITVEGVEWRVVAIETEEPPWAGVLVCERADDVMNPSQRSSRLEHNLPLHLRVFRAIVEAQPTQERIDQALALADEVYEFESGEFED